MINNREKTRKVMVRNVQIGHQNKVIIQSMTNTKTSNVVTTLKQIKTLVNNGAELVRVAVLDDADAMALKSIVHSSPCPIIADIHYNYHFAMTAITSGVAKIRINPANIDPKHLKEIVDCAKVHKTAIRIGANQGSKLNQRQFHTPKEMVDCVCNLIKMFEKWDFNQIVVSLKTSDPLLTTTVYEMASKCIKYPLHLGVTEAGSKENAIIKSSIGLVPLLTQGIGDTIRISISGDPIAEPRITKKILNNVHLYKNIPNVISCPTCGRLQWNLLDLLNKVEDYVANINRPLTIAIMGCAVNGVGECEHADVGVYGSKNQLFIYKKGKLIKKVPIKNGFIEIQKLIKIN